RRARPRLRGPAARRPGTRARRWPAGGAAARTLPLGGRALPAPDRARSRLSTAGDRVLVRAPGAGGRPRAAAGLRRSRGGRGGAFLGRAPGARERLPLLA